MQINFNFARLRKWEDFKKRSLNMNSTYFGERGSCCFVENIKLKEIT